MAIFLMYTYFKFYIYWEVWGFWNDVIYHYVGANIKIITFSLFWFLMDWFSIQKCHKKPLNYYKLYKHSMLISLIKLAYSVFSYQIYLTNSKVDLQKRPTFASLVFLLSWPKPAWSFSPFVSKSCLNALKRQRGPWQPNKLFLLLFPFPSVHNIYQLPYNPICYIGSQRKAEFKPILKKFS